MKGCLYSIGSSLLEWDCYLHYSTIFGTQDDVQIGRWGTVCVIVFISVQLDMNTLFTDTTWYDIYFLDICSCRQKDHLYLLKYCHQCLSAIVQYKYIVILCPLWHLNEVTLEQPGKKSPFLTSIAWLNGQEILFIVVVCHTLALGSSSPPVLDGWAEYCVL